MGILGHYWIIGLLVVVLIIFGPGKLPQIGGAVGTAIKEFRKATGELKDEVAKATEHQQSSAAPGAVEAAPKETPEPPRA
jgi:sec-independent protein translocase protein TatA